MDSSFKNQQLKNLKMTIGDRNSEFIHNGDNLVPNPDYRVDMNSIFKLVDSIERQMTEMTTAIQAMTSMIQLIDTRIGELTLWIDDVASLNVNLRGLDGLRPAVYSGVEQGGIYRGALYSYISENGW